MKKNIALDVRAEKEINAFPKKVRIKLWAYLDLLALNGVLGEPFSKKIKSKPDLYEIRIKSQGAWRVFYAFIDNHEVILLSAIHKKTQKTPTSEIRNALNRLKQYL